jgi:hypothetical protein
MPLDSFREGAEVECVDAARACRPGVRDRVELSADGHGLGEDVGIVALAAVEGVRTCPAEQRVGVDRRRERVVALAALEPNGTAGEAARIEGVVARPADQVASLDIEQQVVLGGSGRADLQHRVDEDHLRVVLAKDRIDPDPAVELRTGCRHRPC